MRVLIGVFLLAILCSQNSLALSVRTWVSGSGIDNATCDRANPCRTFTAAIAATNAGGEIVAIDSAGYGPVTITKSVTILAPAGVHAAMAPTSGNGITVDVPGGKVVLKNLFLNGQGGITGLRALAAETLVVENCVLSNFTNYGLHSSDVTHLIVSLSVFRNAYNGVFLSPSATDTQAALDGCRIERNHGTSILAQGSAPKVVLARSLITASPTGHGVVAVGIGTEFTVKHCIINDHGASGVVAFPGTLIRVSDSTITNNAGYGLQVGEGGTIISYGDNVISGNESGDLQGTITAGVLQ